MHLTEWFIYQTEKRQSAEDDERYLTRPRQQDSAPFMPHCLKCGACFADRTAHVCGATYSQLRRENDRRVYAMIEKERAAEVVLKVGGVKRTVR